MSPELKLCAFDIETRGQVPEFVSGAVVTDDGQDYFTEPSTMIAYLRSYARKKYTLVAHNAEYDVAVLLWGQGEDVRIEFTNGLYTCAWWRYGPGKRSAPIWDSLRLSAGMSLSSLGEAIGLEKYSTPKRLLDAQDVRQDWVCTVHQRPGCIECYNLRDTEIVWGYMNMLREWLGGYGLPLKRSLPAIAMELWQLWDPRQQQTPRSKPIRAIGRAAYHGARCEVFKYGHVLMPNTYDIRRFYGSLLQTVLLPDVASLSYIESPYSTRLGDGYEGAVEATVRIEPQYLPPLPVVAEGRTYFPVGVCRSVWPLSELRASLVRGVTILAVHKSATTNRLLRPFHTTSAALLELGEEWRRQGDPREIMAKFVLNAVIGRLGLRDVSEKTSYRRWRKGMTEDDLRGCEAESADGALYLARRWELAHPVRNTNALWAACITGAGRQRLLDRLLEARDHAVYCDTDSVHTTVGLRVDPDVPGGLINTGSYDHGLYLAPKMYRLEAYDGSKEVRAKGIPRRHAEDFLTKGVATYQTSLGITEAISKGISPATWIDVSRVGHYAPGARTVLDPGALRQPDRYTDTAPVVFQMIDASHMEMVG